MRMLFNFKLFSRVYFSLLLLTLIIITGTIGYMTVEGWDVVDSFYMTIITVSTVGFSEVHDLSKVGQLFTAFLIVTSFGTFAYAVSAITSYLVGGEYIKYFRRYKNMKTAEKMKGHVVVVGFGRVGKKAAVQLKAHKTNFVVIEADNEIITDYKEEDITFMQGDATTDDMLMLANIQNAKALITTLPSDADNLFVVLTARDINRNLTIISRASKQSSEKKLKMAGANNVIMPDSLGGAHMASLVTTPDVMEFLDLISVQGEHEVNLEEVSFEDLPKDLQTKSIGELNSYELTGCNIIGLRDPSGQYHINPGPSTPLLPKSKLFVLGNNEQIKKLNRVLGI